MDNEKNILDLEFLLEFKVDLNKINNKDLMAIFLAINAKDSYKKVKKDKQINCIDKKKQNNLIDKIFDYIYVAQCCQQFSLAVMS